MPDSNEVYRYYLQPFRLVEKLRLNCGYEKSFKLTPEYLLPNRYLLGIDKNQLDPDKLAEIMQTMEMPQGLAGELLANLENANLVLLGFEEGVDDCIYKIYLEYWDDIRQKLDDEEPPYPAETLFLGYKWSAFDNNRAVVTRYEYFPRLELEQIRDRLRLLVVARDDDRTYDVANRIIEQCAQRVDSKTFIFLEAGETENPRKSFDINLYRAGLKLSQVYPLLKQLCGHYSIRAEALDCVYKNVHQRDLGHLSGGIDRAGNPFFTVYYDNQPGAVP